MTPVKRVEIVTASVEIDHVVRVLDRLGVSGYTLVRDVEGSGGRGRSSDGALTGGLTNSYVFTACEPDEAAAIVEAIRPILERFGGVALVSDALWVRH